MYWENGIGGEHWQPGSPSITVTWARYGGQARHRPRNLSHYKTNTCSLQNNNGLQWHTLPAVRASLQAHDTWHCYIKRIVLPDPQLEQTKEQMPKIIASDNNTLVFLGIRLVIQKLRRVTNKDIESSLNIGQFGWQGTKYFTLHLI